ncbi:MAG: EAL domain-containing protein, partial [Rhodocyclaceae bacterium]|nr:EAL domain-containing protein [Rhodocyclaceae bacterium]
MSLLHTSLKWRLVPLVLSLHLVVFGALVWLAQRELQAFAERQVNARAQTLKTELSAALSGPILERDYVTLAEIVQELASLGEIAYLRVEDAAGRELARAGQVELVANAQDAVRDFEAKVAAARVRYGIDTKATAELWREFGRSAASWAVLAALVAAAATLYAALNLVRRIEHLNKAAEAFATGDLEARAPALKEGDELDRLGAEFNRMADEIAARLSALEAARRETAAALVTAHDEHARLVSLLEAMNTGVLLVDRAERVLYLNDALKRMWLIPEETKVIGQPARDLLARSGGRLAQPDHFSRLVLHVPGTQEISDSTELVMNDGRIIVQICRPVRDEEMRLIGRLWLYDDVTQERRNAEQLIYLAERDGLTGLYNRRRFEEALERALLEARRRRSQCALMLFDLDEFKHLNDHFGHRAGDALLVRVANELASIVRRNEILARLGGDEFALLVPEFERVEEVESLAERIIRGIARLPFSFDGRDLRITASMGIATFPQHADTMPDLVAAADLAMYQAKNAGKNGWRLYDGKADRGAIERLGWSERIERAFADDLFELHFQGIHAANGSLLHAEALLRMKDPESGQYISPLHFIAPAEKTGRIVDIDRWVVDAAAATLARHPELSGLAVNVSGRTLAEARFPRYVLETLAKHDVSPQRLLIEVTETVAIADMHDANRLLDALRPAGCRVCLDDFGAGFSSFSYLKHLAADAIKIDGQFVRHIADSREDRLVVRAIVEVAKGLGKMTIAEFVEDARAVAVLQKLGVDAFQGYHFSVPAANLRALLARADSRDTP